MNYQKFASSGSLAILSVIFIIVIGAADSSAQSWSWGRGASGSGVDSWPVATDASGNVFGGGISFGEGPVIFGSYTVTPTDPDQQSVWAKYDPGGTLLWADGTKMGNTWLNSMATDPSGNLLLFGTFNSPRMEIGSFLLPNLSAPQSKYYLAKVSPSGTVLWAIADGNILPDVAVVLGIDILGTGGVTTDPSGNIYITGAFRGKSTTIGSYTLTNADPTGTTYDVFIAKYSPSGSLIWATSAGGSDNDYGFGIAVSSTSDVYIAGCLYSPAMKVGSSVITDAYKRPQAYIASFSSAGVPLWGQSAGGPNGSFAAGLARDGSGNVYMTGGFADASITFGATTLTRKYPGAVPQPALFLVQYSSSNVVTWSKTIGSVRDGVWGYSIALASCGQVWVSGNYNQAAFIDVGDTLQLPGLGGDPIFIAGYNLSGGVVGYSGLGSGGDDQNGIACDAAGNIFMCSDYFGPLAIGPDTLSGLRGDEYFYVGKYSNVVRPPDTTYAVTDTAICVGISGIVLNAPAGYASYYWDDASTDSTRTVTASGKYHVYCVSCGVTVLVDTFNVRLTAADTVYNHTDTSLCSDVKSLTLKGPPGFVQYTWSTGATSTSIVVTTAGTYYVQATAGCDETVDTFLYRVIPDDTTHARHDTTVCASPSPLVLAAPLGYTRYMWSTGSTASAISANISAVSKSAVYKVYATIGCATVCDTFGITVKAVPIVSIGNDTTFCVGNTLVLSSRQPAGDTYLWSTGSTADTIMVSATGIYWLQVTAVDGCATADTIKVVVSSLPGRQSRAGYRNLCRHHTHATIFCQLPGRNYLPVEYRQHYSLNSRFCGWYLLAARDRRCVFGYRHHEDYQFVRHS